MTSGRPALAALFLLLSLVGCSGPATPASDAGRADAASVDAASADAPIGIPKVDAASTSDASTLADAGASTGPDAGSSCATEIDAIENAAAQVWFLGESDRALEVRVFLREGEDAPTEATVVRLAASPAAATHELRATDGFAMHFEPAPGAAPEAPAVLEAAIAAGLTDLIYVAIIEDPSRSAEVRVILAGRTACGELVFIESVSIET